MKALLPVVLFALSLVPLCGKAQARAETNHSIGVDWIGIGYAYEEPLDRNLTLIGRAGLAGGMAYSSWRFGEKRYSHFAWMACPTIGAEARYYHTFDRRTDRGKNTAGNSSSFLSMRAQHYFPGGVSSDDLFFVGGTVVTPGWGFRRAWARHWMFEFNTGLSFGLSEGRSKVGPALNLRFGYTF